MSELHKRETVSEGDTARETVIYLDVKGRELPVEPESAILRINETPVITRTLTALTDGGWYFRWTDDDFTALPARSAVYECQVQVTFDDDSTATFPTGYNLEIKVNDPI